MVPIVSISDDRLAPSTLIGKEPTVTTLAGALAASGVTAVGDEAAGAVNCRSLGFGWILNEPISKKNHCQFANPRNPAPWLQHQTNEHHHLKTLPKI